MVEVDVEVEVDLVDLSLGFSEDLFVVSQGFLLVDSDEKFTVGSVDSFGTL